MTRAKPLDRNWEWDWTARDLATVAGELGVPVNDADAWRQFPRHNWVYDKLRLARLQGLRAAPHGVEPERYPVFSKPLTNLHGMGTGSALMENTEDYERLYQPGHMWMELLTGRHVSTDVVVVAGAPRWWRHATGVPAGDGMFDYWTIQAAGEAAIEANATGLISRHLADFTGIINFETIGAELIEMHLRISDQWPDIYGGETWVDAVRGLYQTGSWRFADGKRRDGYSVALFGAIDGRYRHPPGALIDALRTQPGVSSIQTTFYADKPNDWHSNPPGGFRLAVINGFDLAACKAARHRLAAFHGLSRVVNDTGAS